MPVSFTPAEPADRNEAIFVSASIPDPQRWHGQFDALEITDAVTALARVFLSAGYRIVTAAHPTISPLLLYIAAEFPQTISNRIIIYQSLLFANDLPAATRRFEADGIGTIHWTPSVEGDRPVPGEWHPSLRVMREQMLGEVGPVAACFVGGMEGIREEYDLFRELLPGRPTYPIGRPGGAAIALIDNDHPLSDILATAVTYPTLWRSVLTDLTAEPR
jgi:hypothetical protein